MQVDIVLQMDSGGIKHLAVCGRNNYCAAAGFADILDCSIDCSSVLLSELSLCRRVFCRLFIGSLNDWEYLMRFRTVFLICNGNFTLCENLAHVLHGRFHMSYNPVCVFPCLL